MIILIRHAQSEGNSTSIGLYYVPKKLIQTREPRHSPDRPRPPCKTHTRWLETGTFLEPLPRYARPPSSLHKLIFSGRRSRPKAPLSPPPIRYSPLLHLSLPQNTRNNRRNPQCPHITRSRPQTLPFPTAHNKSIRRAPTTGTRFRELPTRLGRDE